MRIDTLERLEVVFRGWRSKKRHVRERVPENLMVRARRAAAVHGARAVARAATLDYRRLTEGMGGEARVGRPGRQGGNAAATCGSTRVPARPPKRTPTPMPAYSQIEFQVREPSTEPLAEVETTAGLKVRIFKVTAETVSLVSALSGVGRAP